MIGWKKHLKRAVALVGSQAKLATEMARCGADDCSQSKISWLITTADKISAEDALAIHRVTDGQVPASDLRPDLWPAADRVPIAPSQRREPARVAS